MRKTYLVVLGSVIIVVGLAMLALPGPGLLVIAIGLTVLASAGVLWAARLLIRTRERLPLPHPASQQNGLVGQAVSRIDERIATMEAVESVRKQEQEDREAAWRDALVTTDEDHMRRDQCVEDIHAEHRNQGRIQ